MDDVENNNGADRDLAQPEQSLQQEETSESTQYVNDNKENIRALRMGKKDAERRAQEAEKQLKMQQELFMQAMVNKPAAHENPSVDELDSVPDEDYIPKGQVKRLLQKERDHSRKIAQEEVQRLLNEREQSQFLSRLKGKYSDFESVVTSETIELLEQNHPELANTIAELKDPYKIGLQSYEFIKSMGLVNKVPDSRRSKEVDKKLEQNEKTVPSPMAYDKRPMAKTFELTEESKKGLYNEMMKYAGLA